MGIKGVPEAGLSPCAPSLGEREKAGARRRCRRRSSMGFSLLLASAAGTLVLVPLLLCLASVKLWHFYCLRGRDPACPLPLPPGAMGLPFLGETLQLVLQVRRGGRQAPRLPLRRGAGPDPSAPALHSAARPFPSAASEIPGDEAAEIRPHLQDAPLREAHRAGDGGGERAADPIGRTPAGGCALAGFGAHHPGRRLPLQPARRPAQASQEGERVGKRISFPSAAKQPLLRPAFSTWEKEVGR